MKGRWVRIASIVLCSVALEAAGCSRDMAEQPSFHPQEAPRLHSPEGSVPLKSRSVLVSPPAPTPERIGRGAALFEINCSHCHGKIGLGDGPVGRHLVIPPFNLRADQTQRRSLEEIYTIVTDGRVVMPSFKGVLSAEERWEVAYFVKSFGGGENPTQKREATSRKKTEVKG